MTAGGLARFTEAYLAGETLSPSLGFTPLFPFIDSLTVLSTLTAHQ